MCVCGGGGGGGSRFSLCTHAPHQLDKQNPDVLSLYERMSATERRNMHRESSRAVATDERSHTQQFVQHGEKYRNEEEGEGEEERGEKEEEEKREKENEGEEKEEKEKEVGNEEGEEEKDEEKEEGGRRRG